MKHNNGLIIVLSGFSGAGKGTIMKHLLQSHPDDYSLSISATTRKMRDGEKEGREYFFKTQKEFDQMIEQKKLLEYAAFNGEFLWNTSGLCGKAGCGRTRRDSGN